MTSKSTLEKARANYKPELPRAFRGPYRMVKGEETRASTDGAVIERLFPATYGMPTVLIEADTDASTPKRARIPMHVGALFSGGQAPGGHNVIAGLFDGLKAYHPEGRLFGFLMGPDGLMQNHYKEITAEIVDEYRNTGGFDMIGSGRTNLDKKEQFDKAIELLTGLNISTLVIIGGDDSNTNAAMLAEYFRASGAPIQVIGCPKTIDGDMKNEEIECSFGFDTATKVYSELIGNIQRDCASARKYWHFIKLMGRSASHITLECALKCQPNAVIISEEIEVENKRIGDIVEDICRIIVRRASEGRMYGTVLIPEGLIETLPSMKKLIKELNEVLAEHGHKLGIVKESARLDYVASKLSEENASVLLRLPRDVGEQFIAKRDPHGNVQVSLIETEKLLESLISRRLKELKEEGEYTGKFASLTHFFGYEGRCAIPSNYDANYCYVLGRTAIALAEHGTTGYIATVKHTTKPIAEWLPGGVPATMLMNVERRSGELKPVIRKALVDLEGAPYQYYLKRRAHWALGDYYMYPGPMQFFGPSEIVDEPTITLRLEQDGDC